jgi:nucleoside-diphosphate-sugar epimerase
MSGCDAAVTTLGGVNDDGRRVDYKGNSNVVEAAGILGVTRLVLVTSVGCGDSRGAVSDQVYAVLKDALDEKTKVENQLYKFYKFTTDFTIIRPGGLITAPATGKAELTVRA